MATMSASPSGSKSVRNRTSSSLLAGPRAKLFAAVAGQDLLAADASARDASGK